METNYRPPTRPNVHLSKFRMGNRKLFGVTLANFAWANRCCYYGKNDRIVSQQLYGPKSYKK